MFTYRTEKIGLSAFDSKRWICDDGISTYAFGHRKTELYMSRLRPDFRPFNSVNRSWIVIFMGKNINDGEECSITSERYITVRMFAQVVTNTNLNTR